MQRCGIAINGSSTLFEIQILYAFQLVVKNDAIDILLSVIYFYGLYLKH